VLAFSRPAIAARADFTVDDIDLKVKMDAHKGTRSAGPRTGTATRQRGKVQVRKILKEARSLLIHAGYAGLTIRKVARNLDISLGNLTYYFPNKEDLLRALIGNMLDDYHEALLKEQKRFPDDPHGRFLAYIEFLIADCERPDTRAFFFQIWGLATHSDLVYELREQIYAVFRTDVVALIAPLKPDASSAEVNTLAAMLIAMIEGLHIVADLDRKALQLPPDFEIQFRNTIYELITDGLDPKVQLDVNQHLPKTLRRF